MTRRTRIRLLWLLAALIVLCVLVPLRLNLLVDVKHGTAAGAVVSYIRFTAGVLIVLIVPAIVVLIGIGLLERPGRWGLADRTLGAYRYEAPLDQAAKWRPIDWSALFSANFKRIAAIPVVAAIVGMIFLAVWQVFQNLPSTRDDETLAMAVLAPLAIARGLFEIATYLALMILCTLLARQIAYRPGRWRMVFAVWTIVGLGLMAAAAIASDFLQYAINDGGFRRVTPDDYCQLIQPGCSENQGPLGILDDPTVMDDYGWIRLTLTEAASICLISFFSALALLVAARSSLPAALAVPATVLAGLVIYNRYAAPWAYIRDYDSFVGDRILGSLTYDFLFHVVSGSVVSATVLAAFAISMAWMIFAWQDDCPPGPHTAGTASPTAGKGRR